MIGVKPSEAPETAVQGLSGIRDDAGELASGANMLQVNFRGVYTKCASSAHLRWLVQESLSLRPSSSLLVITAVSIRVVKLLKTLLAACSALSPAVAHMRCACD